MDKKLTILLTVFNEEICILKALRSIKANKLYPDVDIVIIDDCSFNSTTIRILNLLEANTNFRIFRSPKNLGLANSRNIGFEKALTEIIVPLDADDILPNNSLDKIYDGFLNNPKANFLYGNYLINSKGSQNIVYMNDITKDGICNTKLLLNNWILLGTSPCKKSLWRRVGGYSNKYANSCQDVDFWIRVLKAEGNGHFLEDIIYNWHRSEYGMNETFDRKDYWLMLDEHFKFISKYIDRKTISNLISGGYYKSGLLLKMIFFNIKYFWIINYKNHLRPILLVKRKIKKSIK